MFAFTGKAKVRQRASGKRDCGEKEKEKMKVLWFAKNLGK
jgi:hypothetical protein